MIATPPDQHTRSSLVPPIQDSSIAKSGKRRQKTNAKFLIGFWSKKNTNGGQFAKKRMATPGTLRSMRWTFGNWFTLGPLMPFRQGGVEPGTGMGRFRHPTRQYTTRTNAHR